ncbi:MAG TPA: hypothetical protein VMJ32_04860 [Pirellulales bacterium]|nr:hypothetical protein [Pirellulales bacterium]
MLIEQAIFTFAKTDHAAGYQLLARSPGVTDRQARELAVWGPSHDALNTDRDEASSVNFHSLPCGTYCVSKTVATGQEHNGWGGADVYTQFLLVPSAVLARFANNPFAVLRAAWAKGVLAVHEQPPSVLEPFTLAGRSATVDEGLLAQFADQWGPQGVARLIAAALRPGIQLLAGAQHCETLIGGLLQCFPVECRGELTFTTGLRFSPRRPFRLSPLSSDGAEQRRALRHEGVTLVDLSRCDMADAEPRGWAAYVAEAIRGDRLARLISVLQQPRPNLRLDDLNALGEQLLEELYSEPAIVAVHSEQPAPQPAARSASGTERLFRTDRPRNPKPAEPISNLHLSDAHPAQFNSREAERHSAGISFGGSEAKIPTVADPAAVELLEQLDDAVYEAVNGVAGAVNHASRLWAQLTQLLPPATQAALREQYLHYAFTLWNTSHEEGVRNADKAIGVLEVLAVLFKPE